VNHRDRETLGHLLDDIWSTRQGDHTAIPTPRGELTPQQREYLTAAMRIVAGTEGPNLPDPWPGAWLHKIGTPRPDYTDPTPPRHRRILNLIRRR
jgi:hypothetical protein